MFAVIAVLVTNAASLPFETLIQETVSQNQTTQPLNNTTNNNNTVVVTPPATTNTTNRTLPANKLSNQST